MFLSHIFFFCIVHVFLGGFFFFTNVKHFLIVRLINKFLKLSNQIHFLSVIVWYPEWNLWRFSQHKLMYIETCHIKLYFIFTKPITFFRQNISQFIKCFHFTIFLNKIFYIIFHFLFILKTQLFAFVPK